jgi:uncharacterized protein
MVRVYTSGTAQATATSICRNAAGATGRLCLKMSATRRIPVALEREIASKFTKVSVEGVPNMPGRAGYLRKLTAGIAVAFVTLASLVEAPGAQETFSYDEMVERVNTGTVRVISGGIGGTYIRIATDLASVLNDGDRLRVLPIIGQGSVQNITDLLYLKGIDIGIVQSDVLKFIKSRNIHPNVDKRIAYITKLYNEEFHLLGDSTISSVKDLAGKKVNFGVEGSGTAMTAATVFESLGLEVEPVYHDQALAIEKIKSGEIAATVYVAGKPTRVVAELSQDDGLRLVPVEYAPALQEAYLPASFSSEDYPGDRKSVV